MKWKSLFEKKILERGLRYFEDGAVEELEINNGAITAIVSGSEDYDVEILLDNGVTDDMYCSCPYAADGNYCKHMAAVLYAYDAMPEAMSLSKRTSPEDLMAKADEKTVRDFLLRALKNDKSLLLNFQMEIGLAEGNVDLKQYRQRIRFLIRQYTGFYGYIDYNSAYYFINDVLDFLHNDVEKLSCSFLKEAFEISTELFIEVSAVEMDDSDGGLTEFGNDMLETWNKMLGKANKQLEVQMFDWFIKHIDGSVIDYMEEFIESFLFGNFTKKEYLLKKLDIADEKISASGESEYKKENWTMRRIELMSQLKMSN